VTIVGAGPVVITANQAASGNYLGGSVSGTLTVTQATPTIQPSIQRVLYSTTKSLTVKASSQSSGALTYSLRKGSPAGTSINPTTGELKIGGTGIIVVLVTQAANGNYSAITTPTTASTITVR